MIRVCLIGLGKTGSEVARVLLEQDKIKLVAAVCSPGSAKESKDLGEVIGCRDTGIMVYGADKLEEVVFKTKPDIAVDFSKPEATIRNAVILSKLKVNMVVATTGFSKFSLKRLFILTRKYRNGIVYAPNITLGVNVMMLVTSIASSILNNYDFQVNEEHHNRKKDIPSGTALKIAGEIEKALETSGTEVKPGMVPINAVRAGGIIGKHEVIIAGEEDMVTISHHSFSRKAFAAGAIRAVKFVYKKAGYYEMSDVLNLSGILLKYIENEKIRQAKKNFFIRKQEDDEPEMVTS
ncbi:MAG: 4-hydroxy-tetrahydrodipicolinate reductase [Bacillota bacterium]